MTPGTFTQDEQDALTEALRWHGLDASTPLHLSPEHIIDTVANVRIAATMAGASPSSVARAFAMIRPMMLEHSKTAHETLLRRQSSAVAQERRRRAVAIGLDPAKAFPNAIIRRENS